MELNHAIQTGPWRVVSRLQFHLKAKTPAKLKSITSRKIFRRHRLGVWVQKSLFRCLDTKRFRRKIACSALKLLILIALIFKLLSYG
jgi:hypothetical protein